MGFDTRARSLNRVVVTFQSRSASGFIRPQILRYLFLTFE